MLASKIAKSGYVLDIDGEGRARLSLLVGRRAPVARGSSVAVNDGSWHHVLAEVDRSQADGITIYVDGKRDAGTSPNRQQP